MDYEKYKNKLPFPQLRKQKYPEPKRKDYQSYASHGIAMDEWERNITGYDSERPKTLNAYRAETNRLNEVFMYDMMDEMGWLRLSDKKQLAISAHLWEQGDGSLNGVYEVAYNIAEMIDVLVAGD